MINKIVPLEDEHAEHPIATDWRPMLIAVVEHFVEGDFSLTSPVPGVLPVDPDIARLNKAYVSSYGQPLISLSSEVWNSSCAQWMGQYWEIIVDLCTETEGVSDLVLTGKMANVNGQPVFTVGLIYVP